MLDPVGCATSGALRVFPLTWAWKDRLSGAVAWSLISKGGNCNIIGEKRPLGSKMGREYAIEYGQVNVMAQARKSEDDKVSFLKLLLLLRFE